MQSALGVEPGALCFWGGYPAQKQGMQSIAPAAFQSETIFGQSVLH